MAVMVAMAPNQGAVIRVPAADTASQATVVVVEATKAAVVIGAVVIGAVAVADTPQAVTVEATGKNFLLLQRRFSAIWIAIQTR
jgi:hypothetical protein